MRNFSIVERVKRKYSRKDLTQLNMMLVFHGEEKRMKQKSMDGIVLFPQDLIHSAFIIAIKAVDNIYILEFRKLINDSKRFCSCL